MGTARRRSPQRDSGASGVRSVATDERAALAARARDAQDGDRVAADADRDGDRREDLVAGQDAAVAAREEAAAAGVGVGGGGGQDGAGGGDGEHAGSDELLEHGNPPVRGGRDGPDLTYGSYSNTHE